MYDKSRSDLRVSVTEVYECRHMKQAFLPRFLKWGIRVERMELLDIIPRNSKDGDGLRR